MLTIGYYQWLTHDPLVQLLLVAATLAFRGWLLLLATWLFYLALMNLKRRLKTMSPVVRFHAYILLAIGYPLDLLFNVTVGTVLFLQPPHPKRLLFTARLQYNIDHGSGWRRARAIYFCSEWLNPFDVGGKHCG